MAGHAAEEFKANIDSSFLGQLNQLDTSYQDAADGFQTYISAVSDIKQRANALAARIYSAQAHYEASAAALQPVVVRQSGIRVRSRTVI